MCIPATWTSGMANSIADNRDSTSRRRAAFAAAVACVRGTCVKVCGMRLTHTYRAQSYKGILDKTRCTYDETEFHAPWVAQKDRGERDSLLRLKS
jgi:hypothetical protein